MSYFVYILTNSHKTVLYTGFTDDPGRRMYEHKHKLFSGFTSRYNVDQLVYFEEFEGMDEALSRERQIKRYKRAWKINLIDSLNPEWRDLSGDFES